MSKCNFTLICLALATTTWSHTLAATAWPTHRGNVARTASSDAAIDGELRLIWRYSPPQPPSPAWPAPARGSYWQGLTSIAPRVVDDHAFHPVVADGRVYFGSSADDTLRAIDLTSGELIWKFTCEGPIRYAPTSNNGSILFGADDGLVYSLDAATGELRWKFRVAPRDRRISGNGRVISAWPVRSSVAVDADESGDVGYTFAGLFPSQRVFAVAFKVDDGSIVWQREVDGSPQGYLLLDRERLIAPMGRANPVVFSRQDGTVVGGVPGSGGTFALIDAGQIVSGRGNAQDLVASDAASRAQLARFNGRHMAVTPEHSFLLSDAALVCRTRTPAAEAWQLTIENGSCLVAGAGFIVVGKKNELFFCDAGSGEVRQRIEIEGEPLGLAIVDEHLIVAMGDGETHCFSTRDGGTDRQVTESVTNSTDTQPEGTQLDAKQLTRLVVKKGFALVAGADNLAIVDQVIHNTDLQIVVVESSVAMIEALRDYYIPRGLYGTRVAAINIDSSLLPLASRMWNVVIDTKRLVGEESSFSQEELRRCLRPFGGLALLDESGEPFEAGPLEGAGRWTHLFASPAGTSHSGDTRIHSELDLQWFGGPGPALMPDRHLRGPSPLVDAGVMIVPGENLFVGVDAYNGTILWQLEAPGSQRYSIPYDCGYFGLDDGQFIVANRSELWLVDPKTGELTEKRQLPCQANCENAVWGYAAIVGTHIIASVQQATAARTVPSRELINADYNNCQPLVTSVGIFSSDRQSGQLNWQHLGRIVNPSISCDRRSTVFVESLSDGLDEHATGRIQLSELLPEQSTLVCLDTNTGEVAWQRDIPEPLKECTNIIYTQIARDRVIVSGSLTQESDTLYRVAVLDLATGDEHWFAQHLKGRPGAFSHGEQVHHPVVMNDKLIAEPAIYDLASGARLEPAGAIGDFAFSRPGHSCGTMSAGGDCLFFRANNPTMFDMATPKADGSRFTALAPSRPGCWINIIPADGLVLIPEASASCVCLYSLQTSMAFAPVERQTDGADQSRPHPPKQ